MNEIVLILKECGDCPICGGQHKMRIRVVAEGASGGLVGIVACPLCCGPAALSDWLAPFRADPVPEVTA